MAPILEALRDYPVRTFAAGEDILVQNGRTGLMFVLLDGAVEVIKDEVRLDTVTQPGAIYGDLSALLDVPHTATVRALRESRMHVVTNPRALLQENTVICFQLCELLARRLDGLAKYLVDVKKQYEGHDHIGMVDNVLETLMNRQPRKRVTPPPSTVRGPEVLD